MAWCRQATSHYLSNVDLDLCCCMASLSHNELIWFVLKKSCTIVLHDQIFSQYILWSWAWSVSMISTIYMVSRIASCQQARDPLNFKMWLLQCWLPHCEETGPLLEPHLMVINRDMILWSINIVYNCLFGFSKQRALILTKIMTWINNHPINLKFLCDVITHPCHNLSGS